MQFLLDFWLFLHCLAWFALVFNLLGVLWASWIWGLASVINSEIFLAINISDIFYSPYLSFFFFFLVGQQCICYTFWNCLTSFCVYSVLFLNSFSVFILVCEISVAKFLNSSSYALSWLVHWGILQEFRDSRAYFISLIEYLIYIEFYFSSLLEFLFTCVTHLLLHIA